jgi:nuclear protein localization family protein 4
VRLLHAPRGKLANVFYRINTSIDVLSQPYDLSYQEQHSIKHLSFHSYLRKLDTQVNKSSATNSYIPPLSNPDYRVKVPCPSGSHPPWPQGICTKCQPSAVTLQLQQYRLVDHVEYSHPNLIEQLLSFWRRTGTQRFGFLLGRYETYDQVPMGVKAVVEAIHEPPQAPEVDGIDVGIPWQEAPRIQALASMAGLKVVGMIYTDLTPDPDPEAGKQGKVLCKRHKDSYFLSSLEALFAAHFQRDHPNPSRFSNTGAFSSKFVTCVVTGDESGGIVVNAYQVSDQAMGLVGADLVEASVDPSVVRIRDEGDDKKRYVPDVFYRYKNQYNIEVKESAKPCFPVDYLLVSVSSLSCCFRGETDALTDRSFTIQLTHGFPDKANPLFSSLNLIMPPFPVENRPGLDNQSLEKVVADLLPLTKSLPLFALSEDSAAAATTTSKGKGRALSESDEEAIERFATWLSNWHLIAYLDEQGILGQVRQPALECPLLEDFITDKSPRMACARSSRWPLLVQRKTNSKPPELCLPSRAGRR